MDYKEFFESLPKWDEEDRVATLQQLVSIKATHLPPRGKKSREIDWFNFLVKIIMSGKASGVIAGNKANELLGYLCPFAEEPLTGLFCCGDGSILCTSAEKLRGISNSPRQEWTMAMDIIALNEDYKRLDIRQLYAQILKR